MLAQLPEQLRNVPPKVLLVKLAKELKRRQDKNKLSRYKPYVKQQEFHNAPFRERLYMACNQGGKTYSSSYEIAMHLTGLYPEWWNGKRWNRAVTGWALGQSMQSTRDTIQRLLIGRPGDWGTGTIPDDRIIEIKRAQGVADSVDCIFVRHISGGISRLYLKSCEQGREKLQGETLDFAAIDEEPPLDIYTEVLTRTNATKGIVWITFTPLLGMSDVVGRFLLEQNPDRTVINMTIDDVEHYSPEERARIIASYPAHERDARAKGIPTMGSGLIFPVDENAITVEPFALPDIWPRICGIDFGWDHKTAIVWLAWDRDTDTVYLYDSVAMTQTIPKDIAPLIIQRGSWVPCAWPHDGLQHDKGSGIQLAEQYRQQGVNMLHEMAQMPETGDENGYKVSRTSVEATVLEMLHRMQTGRWKVFKNQLDWLQERRLYHRVDGKICKERDDLISASRYAMMMLRYSTTPPDPQKAVLNERRNYDWRAG